MAHRPSWKTALGEEIEEIGGAILDVAFEIHTEAGPGLREHHYRRLLAHGLSKRGYEVEAEVSFDIEYAGLVLERALRADLVVAGQVVIEVKSRESSMDYYEAQLLGYILRAQLPLGFLINFREPRLRNGIRRMINSKAAGRDAGVAPSRT